MKLFSQKNPVGDIILGTGIILLMLGCLGLGWMFHTERAKSVQLQTALDTVRADRDEAATILAQVLPPNQQWMGEFAALTKLAGLAAQQLASKERELKTKDERIEKLEQYNKLYETLLYAHHEVEDFDPKLPSPAVNLLNDAGELALEHALEISPRMLSDRLLDLNLYTVRFEKGVWHGEGTRITNIKVVRVGSD